MSSVGYRGDVSRCFNEWQSFMNCFSAKTTTDVKSQCRANAEDYYECLHHKKELQRSLIIAAEIRRKKEEGEAIPEFTKAGRGKFVGTLEDMNLV